MSNREQVLNLIREERERQDSKWGFPQNNSLSEWALILAEEVGEVMKEANEAHFRGKPAVDMCTELIQVAAVCVSALEHLYTDNELLSR